MGVVVLVGAWFLVFGRNLGDDTPLASNGATRLIDVVAPLGADGAQECSADGVDPNAIDRVAPLAESFSGCVLVGSRSDDGSIDWFFVGRANGSGIVRVPRPVEVGQTRAALNNGAVVTLAPEVRVRCTADPNARFEAWIADGRATAGYLDAEGRLVAIDCDDTGD